MNQSTFTATIHKEEEYYVANCVEIGTVSQGKTIDEALENLKEATELYLEEFPLKVSQPTFITTFNIAA
ncbi:MAG TPA: HicB family protein [Bacteroidetes bacterium]|nr:HicB family protein [Bacteroidota bacterium]